MRAAALSCAGLLAAVFLAGPTQAARQLAATAPAPVDASQEFFVRIEDGEFVAGCQRFLLAGWNQWEVVEAAAGAPSLSGASLPANQTGPELVRDLLAKGRAHGFNVMRTWAHSVNPQYALQTAPGRYNEAALRGLDYLLDEARKNDIRLILAFTSNWTPTGGIPEYLKWGGSTEQVDFYTKPAIKDMYKGFVETLATRVNTINGRTYSEDPTILAWNLLNEPRCNGCPPGTVARWYDEMARFTKGVDPNHLVTTGEEGFYGCCNNAANPGQPYTEWAAEEGQDFLLDHASEAIDFATIHAWVDNWQQVDPAWLVRWITDHARDSQQKLKKPLVLEEFGKWVTKNATIGGKFVAATLEERNSFLQAAYAEIDKLLAADTGLKGSLFWQWYNQGQAGPSSEDGGRGLFGIYDTDEAFQPILENAQTVARLNQQPVAGCVPAAHMAAPVAPATDCKQTWVDGQPGTGKEGPDCTVPINECVRGTAACDPRAACVDTEAGYDCRCYWGYEGNGRTCAPNAKALQELQALYFHKPDAVACDAGLDVPYPSDAPGYLYDPMDSFSFRVAGGSALFGSRSNVTLLDCMLACQASEACEGFVVNEALQQCFLKREVCPFYHCASEPVVCNSTDDRGGAFSQPCGIWVHYFRLDLDIDQACANITTVWAGATADPETERIFEETQAALAAEYGTPQLTRLTPGAEKPAAAGARKQPAAVGAAPQAEAKAAAPRPAAAPTPGSVALLEEAPLVQAASSALP